MAPSPREGWREGCSPPGCHGHLLPRGSGTQNRLPSGPEVVPRPCVGQGGAGRLLRPRLATLGVCRSVKLLFFLFSASVDFISDVDGVCSTEFARAYQQNQQTCTTYVKYKKVHGRFGVPHTSNPLEIHNYSWLIRAAFCHGKIKHNSTAREHGSFGNSNLLLHFSVYRDLLLSFTTNSTLKHFIRSGVIWEDWCDTRNMVSFYLILGVIWVHLMPFPSLICPLWN